MFTDFFFGWLPQNSPTCERREAQEEVDKDSKGCDTEDDIKDIDADDAELSESRV